MTNILQAIKYALKDLGRQKIRTVIGLIGVIISVGMLALILFLSDSISYAFVEYLSVDAGNQDMVVSIRHYYGEPDNRSSYFDHDPVIENIKDVAPDINKFIPRMELSGKVNISGSDLQKNTLISGINFSLEKGYHFGTFSRQGAGLNLINSLPSNYCAVYYEFNEVLGYQINDSIEVVMSLQHGNVSMEKNVNLTIAYFFDFELKWSNDYRFDNLIVVDINSTYNIFGYEEFKGKCNKLILTLQEGKIYYDARNLAGSEYIVKEIASKIQLNLGLNEYKIDLPKLKMLGFSEFISMAITIIFVFVSIIAMLISGILINGILKTSVEERIREFGIFRTLGAHKTYNLLVVLLQGLILCGFASVISIILAFFLTQFLFIPLISNILSTGLSITFNISFSSQLISFILPLIIGVLVGLIVSISPAVKVMRLQLIESIHPYRHEDTLYHLKKESSVNYKLIIVGLILAINGGFIYFIIPRILISSDLSLFAGTLIAILLIFLIGLVLAGLGMIPLFLRLMIEIFRPFGKKIYHVIKTFVFRYHRRNLTTIIMCALSFSFVIFTTTVIQDFSSQQSTSISLRIGSDLTLETIGWYEDESIDLSRRDNDDRWFGEGDDVETVTLEPNKIFTTEFQKDILKIEGIERTSSIVASPEQISQLSTSGEKYSADIGDYAGINSNSISLIGIDNIYYSTINNEHIILTQGNKEHAFTDLHEKEYTCIISEAIGVNLDIGLNEKVRITIKRGDETKNYVFTIIGRAATMPGFSEEFSSSASRARMGGVLISQETYITLLGISPIPTCDKLFIKIQDNMKHLTSDIEETIKVLYKDVYNFNIKNLKERLDSQRGLFSTIDSLFSLILITTIIIALFGLLASSYSTIIERKKEIGILRTLGLKGRDISKLFIIEALIIMMSSGTLGVLIGYGTGWLLSSNMSLLSDLPTTSSFPLIDAFMIYGLAIAFLIIGMTLLLRKLRKKKIVEIYRETL